MTLTTLYVGGDSLTQRTKGAFSYLQGGAGSWPELLAEGLANLVGVGPLLSGGLRGVWLGLVGANLSEWTFSSGWTAVASTDAFDKAPYGAVSPAVIQTGNGSTTIATWTKPTQRALVAWELWYIDRGGDWSYRINGGAWTANGQALVNDNKVKKFRVTGNPSTVEIRCANAAGTGVNAVPLGIEPIYSSATSGLVVHDIAVAGSKLNMLCAATSGDRMAVLGGGADGAVTLGTGTPLNPAPTHALWMHINDTALANTTTYATDLTTLRTRLGSIPLGLMNPWECDTAVYDQTQQTNYRAQLKTSAAGFGTPAKVLDHYDRLSAKGITGNAATVAAGLLLDAVHESQAGHLELWPPIFGFVRTLLGIGAVPSAYPVAGKLAVPAYAGKVAAVGYAAGAPVSI